MDNNQDEPPSEDLESEQLKRALDELHFAQECENPEDLSKTSVYKGYAAREKYHLIITKELLLSIHACAQEMGVDDLTCIRRSIQMLIKFVERGANKDTTYNLDIPGRAIQPKPIHFQW